METTSLININVGPLTSINSLVYYISPKLKEIREAYLAGQSPLVQIDLRHLQYGHINISALTALLCISKRLRDFLGLPIQATMEWNPELQGFLEDIGFFRIAIKFNLYKWVPDGIVGGYKKGKINPNTKILHFGDITSVNGMSPNEIAEAKAFLKQRIAPNFLMRCAALFNGFDSMLEDVVSNTALELIANSLMHGEEIAFVGMQRSSKRITISVCDSGIGFPKSLNKTYNKFPHLKDLSWKISLKRPSNYVEMRA